MRDNSYFHALNQIFRQIENTTGLSYGTISEVSDVEKTAEEVRISKQRSFVRVCDIQKNLQTALEQLAAAVSLRQAEDAGCYLMEITAHSGARPDHAKWQGQLVTITGKDAGKIIDGLRVFTLSEIGYGSGEGFKGWNCRHNWHAYYPGLSTPNYTQEELKKLDEPCISYNGKLYTEYEVSQMQRAQERRVRAWKRRCVTAQEGVNSATDEATRATAQAEFDRSARYLKTNEAKLKDFCRQTGQDRDRFREQVLGFNRSTAQKAVHAAKKSGLTSGGKDGIIKEKDMFHTKDDPIREILGSAEQSHPEKVKEMMEYLKSVHVDVIIRDENESMCYQPGLSAGKPGQIVLNKQASISAWMHEVQHVKDDEAAGWSGMRVLYDNDERYRREKKAYDIEINFAKQLNLDDVVKQLLVLLDDERKRIYNE